MGAWHRSDQLKTLAFAMVGAGLGMANESAKVDDSIFLSLGLYFGGIILSLGAVVLALEVGRRDQMRKNNTAGL
jgi:hypothetical protein